MIVNTRAGSRGARRIHPWRRASGRGRARRAVVTVGASAVIWASVGLTWRWSWSSRRPVCVADGLGVELSLRERRRHGLLAGDGRTLGRHIGGDLGSCLVLRQRHELEVDVRMLVLEEIREPDGVLHLRVGDD